MKRSSYAAALTLAVLCTGCPTTQWADSSRELGPPVADGPAYPVTIHQPTTLGVADGPYVDVNGTPIGVACDTCHGEGLDGKLADQADPDVPVHGDVEIRHGDLSCDFCHAADRTKLHLADGTEFGLRDALRLCTQCHGPQVRDYKAGVHGGMNGYWDLRRGPRDRNHCVDCHAPHSPKYERVMPVHMPNDRFLDTSGEEHGRL